MADATYAGFAAQDVSNYLGPSVGVIQAQGLINLYNGLPLTEQQGALLRHDIPVWTTTPATSPVGGTTLLTAIQAGFRHLSEHPAGSHYHGDFGAILDSVFRGFTALFTLGVSEIPIGGKPLGETSGLQSLVSTELSGGSIQSKPPTKQIGTIERIVGTGASLVSGISAAYAGFGAAASEATVSTADVTTTEGFTASSRFGTQFSSNLGNTLDIGQVTGPSTLESALFGTPVEGSLTSLTQAAQLGLTPEQLLAPTGSGILSGVGKLTGQLGEYTGVGSLGNQLYAALVQGNFALVGNLLLGAIGVPPVIPGSGPDGSGGTRPGVAPGVGGGFGGGGGVNPSYDLTTSPHQVNVPLYVIGAFLIGLMLWMVLRKG